MESYLLSVICIWAIMHVSLMQSVTRFSLPPSSFGKGLENWWLDFIYGLPLLSDCAKECYYLRICASFQFNKSSHLCILSTRNSTQPYTDTWYEGSQLVFSDKKDWPKAIVGSCADEPCSMKEKCLPGRTPSCIPYCGVVPTIDGAFFYSGCGHVGCVLGLECYDGFVATTTDAKMTCQKNATWTSSFQCIRHCGTPPNVSNAIVGPGLETKDANRSYTCQDPYIATPSSTTITCQANSTWTTPQFQCSLL